MNSNNVPIFLVLSLLWIMMGNPVSANKKDYYYYQLSIDKGLSQASVTSILLDTNGVVWMGTKAGLNTFDHHETKNFFYDKDNPASLPGNYIHFVVEDKLQNIWIGTNKGLVRYQRSNNSFLPAIKGKVTMAYSFLLRDDGLFFGSANGLYKYNYQLQKLEYYPTGASSGDSETINFILTHNTNELILLSSKSISTKFNLNTHTFSTFTLPDKHAVISAVFRDREGNYYLAPYRDGLYCYDKNWNRKYHLSTANGLSNNIVLSIIEKDNKLWLATDGGGINIVDKQTSAITTLKHVPGETGSLPVNSIICLYKDHQNNLFAGSVRGGMFGIREVHIKTFGDAPLHFPYGLNEKSVISIYEDSNEILWVGTDGGGINRYDPATGMFKHYPLTASGKVLSLTEYSDSELLVSFYSDRTYLFNKQTGKCIPFDIVNPETTSEQCSNDFTELAFRLSKDRIYFLSSSAFIYNVKRRTFSKLKTRESPSFLQALNPVYADEQTAYFIQNRGNRIFEVSQNGDSLKTMLYIGKDEVIMAACRDREGTFWIGTDYGLFSFNPVTKEYKKVETRLFNNVSTVLCDKHDRLWIGAQNMLFSYDIKQQKFISWAESDGFSPNELPYMYQPSPNGKNIYLGGVSGLVCIAQDIVTPPKELPKVKLSDVIVDGSSLLDKLEGLSPSITLPWNHSSVVIKVLSIEKDIFRKKLFRFQIIGLNDQSISTYRQTLSLQTLPPGKYAIAVSCNAKNGDWTAPSNVLHIIVTPPWYKNPAIVSSIATIIFLLLVWGLWIILRRKEKRMQWKMNLHEQKINKEKIQFLINISHELRTPLTLAYAPLKRMLDREEWKMPDAHIESRLHAIYRQLHQMRELINMVLDQNSITEGEDKLRKAPHSVNDWITATTEDFKGESKEKGINLVLQLDPSNPIAEFDAMKCRSVLSNLLMNALKFSDSGTSITVKSETIEKRIRVSICDQGIGLKNVDTQKLFTRHYQGKHDEMGSGIGLSYSKMLMEKHGGSIGVMENGTQGAIFYFEFPQGNEQTATDNLEEFTLQSIPELLTNSRCFDTTKYSIVIAEDNEELLNFMKDALHPLFKHIYAVNDGCKALEIITSRFPDIIVSDVMMPRMNGFELCKRVKEDITVSHIPVILLTARGNPNSQNTGYKLGADAYLAKPFEEDLLMAIIVNQLKSREAIKQKYHEQMLWFPSAPAAAANLDEEFLFKLNKLIDSNLAATDLDVKFLTAGMGMSRTPLFTKLKALTNMGINDYVNRIRIEKASHLLLTTPKSIVEISDETGFSSQKYFSTIFKQVKGKTPSQYRQDNLNDTPV